MNPINAYLVLGTVGSGRLGTVYDIMQNGFMDGSFTAVFASANEPKGEFDAKISDADSGGLITYADHSDVVNTLEGADAGKFTNVIYIADSSKPLSEEIEFFKSLCDKRILHLCRIWGFIDCELFSADWNFCEPYFDAIAHFSDCVFLTNRSGLEPKQINAIKARYEKMCHPHLYIMVKNGFHVDNALEITIDEARRISMYFDDYDPVDELDLDEDNLPEEPFNLERKPDIYLQKDEGGKLLKPLPDLRPLRARLTDKKRKKQEN